MALIIVRHAERLDYMQRDWVQVNPKPFDTPITKHGHRQAHAAGAKIRELVDKHQLPPVKRVYTSPLTRCVETSIGLGKGLGSDISIALDTCLVEAMVPEWYCSWGIKGVSDSTWKRHPLDNAELRQETLLPAHEILPKAGDYDSWEHLKLASHHSDFIPHYNIHDPEEHAAMKDRIGAFAVECAKKHPGETVVLVSHGGPSAALFEYLSGISPPRVGFTAISVLSKQDSSPSKGSFEPLLTSCTKHIENLTGDGEHDLGFATAF
mmetsp:Transcript_6248/g.9893  ORF Transcript_6248/g.9893 Transcript_6248/m.9893 type:complete len:265 (+) Transcript_6248:613-1407(+)